MDSIKKIDKTKKISNTDYGFLVLVVILGLFNAIGTNISVFSLLATVIEYGIVLSLLFNRDYKKSFIYFVAFTAITLENDIFIYGDNTSAHADRFTFFNLPIVHALLFYFLSIVYLYKSYKEAQLNNCKMPNLLQKFKKWTIVLFITGTISIIIAMFVNDNGIMNWNYYPKEAIIQIFGYAIRVSILLTSAYLVCDEKWCKALESYLLLIIAAISIICTMTTLLGFHGYYSDSDIMLSTLAIAFTPFLIVFANKNVDCHTSNKMIALITGVIIIVASFAMPNCIGSKWYMIILAAIAAWLIIFAKVSSPWKIGGMVIVGLFLLTLLSEPLIGLISGGNEFVEWKLTQAVKTMNILGQESAQDWYEDMDNSPLYRFDELHNTFIEYTEKPWYALFGKGLGGTIRHHTNLLFWESGHGTFSESQIKMGAYHTMHETLAVLFLQHGIAGICFFFMIIALLVKRLYKTPWAMIGFIWILFYWSYGMSLIIGGIAMVLAFREDEGGAHVKTKKKKRRSILR